MKKKIVIIFSVMILVFLSLGIYGMILNKETTEKQTDNNNIENIEEDSEGESLAIEAPSRKFRCLSTQNTYTRSDIAYYFFKHYDFKVYDETKEQKVIGEIYYEYTFNSYEDYKSYDIESDAQGKYIIDRDDENYRYVLHNNMLITDNSINFDDSFDPQDYIAVLKKYGYRDCQELQKQTIIEDNEQSNEESE